MSTPTARERTRCEVWTRVMGYHRPVSHFNIGKKAEHMSRKHFLECLAANQEFEARYARVSVGADVPAATDPAVAPAHASVREAGG